MIYSRLIPFLLTTATSLLSYAAADPPECNFSYTSDIPAEIFSGVSSNVYTQFCSEVDKYNGHQPVSWTVNITGDTLDNILPRILLEPGDSHSIRQSSARSPAPPPLTHYTFDLAYNPTSKAVACTPQATCSETFSALAASCGTYSNNEDPDGKEKLMAYRGSHGSGCGLYTYYIAPPAPAVGERQCYPRDFFGSHHMKAQSAVLSHLVGSAICTTDRPRISAADRSTWVRNKLLWGNMVPYVFSAYWRDGCYQRIMDADFNHPIPDQEDVSCTGLLLGDYGECLQNDGIGGNVTAGCVVYEYKTLDQRVHGGRTQIDNHTVPDFYSFLSRPD